jgi:hypothetical protein
MKTSNKAAREAVQNLEGFKGSHTFGESRNGSYIVYSYGRHWPLFIYSGGVWYENADRYSVTTSQHRSKLHPLTETKKMSLDEIRNLRDNLEIKGDL